MLRLYSNRTIDELEAIFDKAGEDTNILRTLSYELQFRSSHRAKQLAAWVKTALKSTGSPEPAAPAKVEPAQMTDVDPDQLDANSPQSKAAKRKVLELRQRLLDLSNRNRLINFKHTAKGGRQIRIVDEWLPDLQMAFADDKAAELVELPPLPEEPDDEADDEFVGAYEEALLTDKVFLRAVDNIEAEAGDDSEAKMNKARRALKDRLRKKLGRMPRAKVLELSIQAHATRFGINSSYDLDETLKGRRRRKATHWQTLLSEDELARRLRAIEQQARESREEYGVETLYMVLGYLEWYEATPAGEAESMLLSPLVLQPVGIEKKSVLRQGRTSRNQLMLVDPDSVVSRPRRETYLLSAGSDEISVNLCLRERLRQDCGLELPEWDEDSTLEKYLAQVERAIEGQPNWKVRRYATLTHLSFSRLAMWLDLDCESEECPPPHLVPVIAELLGGRDSTDGDKPAVPVEGDYEDSVPALVMDCDSSQFAAIRSALRGENLVIQGPPGTGKSQTISNLIAAALWQGKTVLFVAEKMAALDVVHKRLTDAGLGDFLLELHSAKSGKKPVLESIRKRLKFGHSDIKGFADVSLGNKRKKLRDQLTAYSNALNSQFGVSGWTNHDIFWMKFAFFGKTIPANLGAFVFAGVNQWDQDAIELRRASLMEWEEVRTKHTLEAGGGTHPWEWVQASNLFVSDCDRLLDQTRVVAKALYDIEEWISQRGLVVGIVTIEGMGQLVSAISNLGARPPEGKRGLWLHATSAGGAELTDLVVSAIQRRGESNQLISDKSPGLLRDEKAAPGLLVQLTDCAPAIVGESGIATIDSLNARLGETVQILTDFIEARSLLTRTSSILGMHFEAPGADEVDAIAVFLRMAAKVPPALVSKRHSLGVDGATDRFREHLKSTKLLRNRIEMISGRLVVPFLSIDLAEVTTAMTELAKGGLFAWFRSEYWKAGQFVKKISPTTKRLDRGALLGELIQLIGEHTRLVTNTVIMDEAGVLFRGLETDVDAAESACVWIDEVKYCTPILATYSMTVRSGLFTIGSDFRDLAKSLEEHSWSNRLASLAERCRHHGLGLEHLEAKLKLEESTLRKAISLLLSAEWCGEYSVNWLHRLKQEWDAKLAAEHTLLQNPHVAELLCPDVERNVDFLMGIWAGVKRVDELPLPMSWRNRLRNESGAGSWVELAESSQTLKTLIAECDQLIEPLAGLGRINPNNKSAWHSTPVRSLHSSLTKSIDAALTLTTRSQFLASNDKLAKLGLAEFAGLAANRIGGFSLIDELFRFVMLRSMCYQVFEDFPCLADYRHSSPDAVREKFRTLDKRLKESDRCALVNRLLERHVPSGIGSGLISQRTEGQLLQYVANLERPRTSVRELLRRSGRALQALKPCFMMSPLSVAQLINRGQMAFDLVIFDEASQVKPEDALSALSRGRQFVVVGDKMQLPPTTFGDKGAPDEWTEDDETGEFEESAAVESILESVEASCPTSTTLLWHYRSRDPSLIAFSNREYYQNRLQLFPAPRQSHPSSGVKYVWVGGLYSARTNLEEARCCAKAAIDLMRHYPERSLGIVALNRPQADLIELELDKLIHETDEAQEYQAKWADSLEPIFVKNLENVQGDERDVIFISTVFGYDDGGRFYQRFGPINSKVGHRRLNVLFSRAKHQLVLFTSIPSEKIQVTDTSNWGVRSLKQYLEYARSGRLETGLSTGKSEDSPFEVAVRRELEAAGFQCEPQVGVAGFFIDLAVRHPQFSDHYLLGIECDGASYHRSQFARDRDRLRQEILEGLGWEIFRIWSTDWFSDPVTQLGKLIAHIERLRDKPLGAAHGHHIDFSAKFGRPVRSAVAAEATDDDTGAVSVTPAKIDRVDEKWLRLTRSEEFVTCVQGELVKRQSNSVLRELLGEAFDLRPEGLEELEIEVAVGELLSEYRSVELYNRAIYEWLDRNPGAHLGSMPWVSNRDTAANVRLRSQAVVDVVARFR